jgi:hypothetical protein
MFQTLDEQIETTGGGHATIRARLIRFFEVAAVLLVLFAGLYLAIRSFE